MATAHADPLTADERTVLDAIDAEAVIADLEALVAIPSVGGTAAEAEAQRWCAERLRALGLAVDEWDIDVGAERSSPGFPGMEVEREEAVGCVGVLGGPGTEQEQEQTGMPALALCGHTDVVPPGDPARWPGRDPYTLRREGGRLLGRGVCDMKGGLAAVLGAVAALARSGVALREPLAVHCVSGEEDGGVGAFATLRRGHLARACVIAEPTDGSVVSANAGSLTFRLEVEGLATHGSTRTRGISAVDKLGVLQAGLRALEHERNAVRPEAFAHLDLAWPLSIGKVRSGDWASTVPDLLVAEGRFGVRPGESIADAKAAFETAVTSSGRGDTWLVDHPVRVTWPGGEFAPGALPEGHPLAASVASAVNDLGDATPSILGAPYGSDLRHYAAAGVPTVQYGPGEVRFAHAADEQVSTREVLRCARVFALLALRECGTAG